MVVKLVKSFAKIGFYVFGLAAVVGVWDFTQQSKDADNQYSFAEYQVSVMDRYGEEVGYAVSALDTVGSGVQSGLSWVGQTEILNKASSILPTSLAEPALAVDPRASDVEMKAVEDSDFVKLASVAPIGLAPETSLLPRARASF